MNKCKLKDNTRNKLTWREVYSYSIYLRDSKTTTDRGLVNFDNGQIDGSHWPCFYRKDNADSTSGAGSLK